MGALSGGGEVTDQAAVEPQWSRPWRPAQPYEEGNRAALKHGADSARSIQPVADELLRWSEHLADVAPWACGPAHASTVAAWAWAEARCLLVRRWLDERQAVNDEGEVPAAANYREKLERRARTLRADLGLGPLAEAKLLVAIQAAGVEEGDTTPGVEALRAAGQRILESRGELVERDDDGDENQDDDGDAVDHG